MGHETVLSERETIPFFFFFFLIIHKNSSVTQISDIYAL